MKKFLYTGLVAFDEGERILITSLRGIRRVSRVWFDAKKIDFWSMFLEYFTSFSFSRFVGESYSANALCADLSIVFYLNTKMHFVCRFQNIHIACFLGIMVADFSNLNYLYYVVSVEY